MKKKHIGSDFDDFLREEQLLEVSEATAAKRVIVLKIRPDGPREAFGDYALDLSSRISES